MVNIHIFKPIRHWNLDRKDIIITSKRQLAEEAEKRGLYCPALDSDAHERRARERRLELNALEEKRERSQCRR